MTTELKKSLVLLKALIFHYHGLDQDEKKILETYVDTVDARAEYEWAISFISQDYMSAFERAKKFLKQYSYREVAAWLSTQSGKYISHVGLYKRVKIEQQRKNEASTQRYLAQRYKEALQKAQKLETQRLGYRERVNSSTT